MRSDVYVQAALSRLSKSAWQGATALLANPVTREVALRALCSPDPERSLAQIIAHRIAVRVRPDAGLGIETITYGQLQKQIKLSSADEKAALKAAKKDKSGIAAAKQSHDKDALAAAKAAYHDQVAAAQEAYKEASHPYEGVKTTKAERQEIVSEIGKAGQGYHWDYKADKATGEMIAVRAKDMQSGNFFSKVGRTLKPFVPIIIGAVGAILAIPTGGASLAIAAVLSAGYQINEKRIATNKAEREGKKVSKQMKQQVKTQTQQLNQQLDDLYKQNPDLFTAAGISSSKWAGMSVDQKLAVVERINSGQMPSTAANVAAASDAQGGTPPATLPPDTPVDATIAQSPFMTPQGSVDPTPAASGGGGGFALAAGAVLAGAAMLTGKKHHR